VGYRLLARDTAGVEWQLSAGGPALRELELSPGEQTLELDAGVHMSPRIKDSSLQVGVQGDGGAGLTLYRAGKRIPLGYRVLDASGRELESGKIHYG